MVSKIDNRYSDLFLISCCIFLFSFLLFSGGKCSVKFVTQGFLFLTGLHWNRSMIRDCSGVILMCLDDLWMQR
jgi:hypothetical protein